MRPKLSPIKAIRAFCIGCVYDSQASGLGSAMDQTEACTATECELYHLRPVTGKLKAQRQFEKVAAMTPEQRQKYDANVDAARERFKNIRACDSH